MIRDSLCVCVLLQRTAQHRVLASDESIVTARRYIVNSDSKRALSQLPHHVS